MSKLYPAKGSFFLGLALLSQGAFAQEQCNSASLQFMPVITVRQALDQYKSGSLAKDEFETTAAYNARVAAAQQGLPVGPILVAVPQTSLTKFDADNGLVTVSPYAISGTCRVEEYGLSAEMKAVRFGNPSRYGEGSSYCISRQVKSEDGGTYEATNGFGAKTTVEKSNVKMEGIFFGVGDLGQELIAGRKKYSSEPLFVFAASADEARSLKENAEIVVLVDPVSPFTGKGSYLTTPTFKSPRETFFQTDFLVGKPRCFAIRDGSTGRVFASLDAIGTSAAGEKNRK